MDRFFSFLTFIPRRVEQAYVPQTFTEMDEPCVRQDAPYNITDEWFSNQPRLEPEKVIENEPTYEVYNVYLNPNGTIRLDETKPVEEFDETKLILLDPNINGNQR